MRQRIVARAADRIAARYRGRDASRLAAFMETAKMQTPSEIVRDAIHKSGLSLCELSRRSGVDAGILSRFMAGQRSITLATLDRLSDELGGFVRRPRRRRRRAA